MNAHGGQYGGTSRMTAAGSPTSGGQPRNVASATPVRACRWSPVCLTVALMPRSCPLTVSGVRGRAGCGEQPGIAEDIDDAAAQRPKERGSDDAFRIHGEVHERVDQAPRPALIRRAVIDEIEQDAHVEGPQQRRRHVTDVYGQPLAGNRLREDRDAALPLSAGCRPEPGQGMVGVAAVAEE